MGNRRYDLSFFTPQISQPILNMSTIDLLLYGQLAASAVMIVGWVIALLIKNTSYVDVLWAYGVGVLGISFLVIQSDQCHPARLAVLEGILAVWSLRLGTHLLRRCWGKPEDARYAYLREYLGKNANLGLFLSFFRYRPSGSFSSPPPF